MKWGTIVSGPDQASDHRDDDSAFEETVDLPNAASGGEGSDFEATVVRDASRLAADAEAADKSHRRQAPCRYRATRLKAFSGVAGWGSFIGHGIRSSSDQWL